MWIILVAGIVIISLLGSIFGRRGGYRHYSSGPRPPMHRRPPMHHHAPRPPRPRGFGGGRPAGGPRHGPGGRGPRHSPRGPR